MKSKRMRCEGTSWRHVGLWASHLVSLGFRIFICKLKMASSIGYGARYNRKENTRQGKSRKVFKSCDLPCFVWGNQQLGRFNCVYHNPLGPRGNLFRSVNGYLKWVKVPRPAYTDFFFNVACSVATWYPSSPVLPCWTPWCITAWDLFQ